MKNKVVLLFGNICSGKTTLARTKYKKYTPIKVSDIVKKVSGAETRSELQSTADRDVEIAKTLVDQVWALSNTTSRIVIDGIRQPSIVEFFLRHIGRDWEVDMVWVDTPLEECKARFYARAQERDSKETFEEVTLRDDALGLNFIPLLYKQQLRYETTKSKAS